MTRQNFEPPRAVLCGSYKRDRAGLFRVYDELVVTGCQVFVMLHAPKGYVGLSAAMEIGFATAQGCPVFSRTAPQDIALRRLVNVVPSVYDVLCVVGLR